MKKTIRERFFDINLQLETGLQVLLESRDVPRDTRRAVKDFIGDVVRGLSEVERDMAAMEAVAKPKDRDIDYEME